MSLSAVFETLGQQVMPAVLDAVSNGECRVLEAATVIDGAGFPAPTFTPRTVGFLPCVWKLSLADEKSIAEQPRGVLEYKITIPRHYFGDTIEIETSDRLELVQTFGGPITATLEIIGPINKSNVVWEAICIDIDAP